MMSQCGGINTGFEIHAHKCCYGALKRRDDQGVGEVEYGDDAVTRQI